MIRLYFLLLVAISCLYPATIRACGYGFIGGCSTDIGLRINGTLDSFAIAPCQNITDFNGLSLGVIRSLSLAQAKSINWESCQNNVTSVAIYFRVFQTGTPGGAWQILHLQDDYYTLVGPYTTRYRSINANVNLTDGLVVGHAYTLEAYFRAEVDTIGDDFIPETFIVQNNDGINYHLDFNYGGPSGPPFTVVNTSKMEPHCYGDSTGVVGVSVYGDQTDLFYHWNYEANDNFYRLYNIPAGMYILTVSGAGGYSHTDTIVLGQPQPINNQFVNYVPFSCANNLAQVTAQASGGSGPYTYQWSNGDSTAGIATTLPGNYTVTVTDAQGCSRDFTQIIGNNNSAIFNIQADICSGETYHIGNQSFVLAGSYNITLTSANGCDTLIHLELGVLNPAALLTNLPTAGMITCAQPTLNLCATAQPNAAFSWRRDEFTVANTACLSATAGGVYTVTATLAGTSNKVCPAYKTLVVQEHTTLPIASVNGQFVTGCVPSSVPTWLHAVTNAQNPTYRWTYNGQTLSTTDSCSFVFAGWTGQGGLVIPTLIVTDMYGCTTVAEDATTVLQNETTPLLNISKQNLCNGLTEINYDILGGTLPYQIEWNNAGILTNPFTVPSGMYTGTVTDAAGCISMFTVTVEPFSLITAIQMATGPNIPNGEVMADLSGGSMPYTFLWSNGNTTPQITGQLPGSYCVTATDSDGCTQDTCVVISFPSATWEARTSTVSIVPNPVTPGDWLELGLPTQMLGEKLEIEIFDATGRSWWRENQTATTATLQVLLPTKTPTGLLLVRIRSAHGQATGRFVAR